MRKIPVVPICIPMFYCIAEIDIHIAILICDKMLLACRRFECMNFANIVDFQIILSVILRI